jgi:tetratricopeptide (TPR) repeat protein
VSDKDLMAFRNAWLTDQDGLTGSRYVEALNDAGRSDAALEVCAEIWNLGYVIGLSEAAWILREQGEYKAAIQSMTLALDHLDDDDRLLAKGIIGVWRWHHLNDAGAEDQLRAGMHYYDSAWSDLGQLLCATGRAVEGMQVLADGSEAGILDCMVPLANRLSKQGDRAESEALYRRAYELGDGHAAWNLSLDLLDDGREEEASDWQWRAAALGDEVAIQHLAAADPPIGRSDPSD